MRTEAEFNIIKTINKNDVLNWASFLFKKKIKTDMIQNIVSAFEGFRMQPTPLDQYEQTGKAILAEKITPFVEANKPIEFVMLGFPFKSTNSRDKVLGVKPDMAEEVTLKNFKSFDQKIKEVYPAGVNVSIVSDGYIFNDLLGASDATVQEYKELSQDMGKEAPLKWFDLYDFYGNKTKLPEARDKVMNQFGVTPEALEREILFNPDVNFLYKGMTIFMMEELAVKEFPSKNQLQKAAKKLTREMMLRNEAYSNLIRSEFKNHIRLSMHPSVNNGQKYSFQLIPSSKARHSAWHCSLVVDNNELITMHRKDAVEAGYILQYKDGQPYYFTK